MIASSFFQPHSVQKRRGQGNEREEQAAAQRDGTEEGPFVMGGGARCGG